MGDGTPERLDSRPKWRGSPVYGYNSPIVQQNYVARESTLLSDLFMPYLRSGMTLLDCGCGPGTFSPSSFPKRLRLVRLWVST